METKAIWEAAAKAIWEGAAKVTWEADRHPILLATRNSNGRQKPLEMSGKISKAKRSSIHPMEGGDLLGVFLR